MNFEQFTPEANLFIKKVAMEMGAPEDTDQAYRVSLATFHTLREILTPEESLHLISQLPLLVKALYVHEWRLHRNEKIRSMPEFLLHLRSRGGRTGLADFGDEEKAKARVRAVLKVVKMYVTPGETEDVLSQMPSELLELWATKVDNV
jgi:uncharacterized protein (DUF2267 family)